MPSKQIIRCRLLPETKERIEEYADALKQTAPTIGKHGLSEEEFWRAGIFRSAIERIRGTQSATMAEKRAFVEEVLAYLVEKQLIEDWHFSGSRERYDYEVGMPNGRTAIIETKGCLDGNNTNIFQRPPQADEFIIWSLCQNPGADPEKNARSGIVTRLSAEIIHRRQVVDGLIIWDMICGTIGRPCPKIESRPKSVTTLPSGRNVPPPCFYLFPRTVPDSRNNPSPSSNTIKETLFLAALHKGLRGKKSDVTQVNIEVRQQGRDLQRKVSMCRQGADIPETNWVTIRRANE